MLWNLKILTLWWSSLGFLEYCDHVNSSMFLDPLGSEIEPWENWDNLSFIALCNYHGLQFIMKVCLSYIATYFYYIGGIAVDDKTHLSKLQT